MTFEDEVEVRHASVGTKVLAFGFAIFAVLGSFWGVVWFIRSYVEQPRVNIAPSSAFAAQENPPAAPSAPARTAPALNPSAVIPAPMAAAQPPAPPPPAVVADATPRSVPAAQPAVPPSSTGSVSDRWGPIGSAPTTASPATAPAPAVPDVPNVIATAPASTPSRITATKVPTATVMIETPADLVAESSVPAISAPAPLPRRKPTQVAAVPSREPPLPRPRPDGSTPQSIWTAVPTTDDRYQSTQ
jgi:hypothetical protein